MPARLPQIVLLLSLLLSTPTSAQEATSSAGSSNAKLILAFRMQNWHAQHMHDAAAAAKQAETLRTLGCEVKTSQHNGHTDVQCRTVFWKSMALDTQEQLQQWQAWLTQAGFDTLHGKPASVDKPAQIDGKPREIVKFRAPEWRSQHIHNPQEVGQLTTLYRALGCELENAQHDGHTDLRIRCSQWREVELASHDAAHKWQDFLNKAGFETTHEH